MSAALVGTLGSVVPARVDGTGRVDVVDAGWQLDWWIGAEDRWHVPGEEAAVRQVLVDGMPVVQTSMRVPSGDAVQRVYGAGGPLDLVVVEIENASPAPFVVALVLTGRFRSVGADGGAVTVDGLPALLAARPAARWAAAKASGRGRGIPGRSEAGLRGPNGEGPGALFDEVRDGRAQPGPFAGAVGRRGRLAVALLFPVTHRTATRFAVVNDPRGPAPVAVELGALPSADDAARGWRAQLERGMRVELPDDALAAQVDTARAAALLEGSDVAALEDWGFDAEAAAAWSRLSVRARRRVARREDPSFLVDLRRELVRDEGDSAVALLPGFRPEWRGQSLAVHDAPTRAGRVSFAVRWHGDRPALLWESERPSVRLTTPSLDPTWSTTTQSGEALLH